MKSVEQRHRTNHVVEEEEVGKLAQPEPTVRDRHPRARHDDRDEGENLDRSFHAKQSDKNARLGGYDFRVHRQGGGVGSLQPIGHGGFKRLSRPFVRDKPDGQIAEPAGKRVLQLSESTYFPGLSSNPCRARHAL